jgi:hypothetical protein
MAFRLLDILLRHGAAGGVALPALLPARELVPPAAAVLPERRAPAVGRIIGRRPSDVAAGALAPGVSRARDLAAAAKLQGWGRVLPPAALGETSREQVQSLLTSLQQLSDRLHALLEVRSAREPGHRAQELLEDMGAWRPGVPEAFARLASDPGAVDPAALCSSRETLLAQLEARVAQGFGQAGEPSVPVEEGEHLYRLLSASRGLSRALVGVVERLAPIEWARLREARF